MNMKRGNIFYFFAITVLAGTAIMLGIFFYLIILPPVKFKLNSPLYVAQAKIKQGGNVSVTLDYCKYTNDTPLTYFAVIDHSLLPAIPLIIDLPSGCNKKTISINLAYSTPIGKNYKVVMIKNYPQFVFAGATKTYFSNSFEITHGTDEDN